MKKTVFLLLFLLCLGVKTSVSADLKPLIFTFEDYEFRLTQKGHPELGRGYVIQKLGENPFTVEKLYLNHKYYITNCKEINNLHVFYGYTHNYEGDNYYDPFVLIIDKEGNDQFVMYDDFGELEEVRDIIEIDNVLLFKIEQSIENEEDDFEFYNNVFVTYDFEYQKLNEVSIDKPIYRYETTEELFLYDFDYEEGYSGALTSDLVVLKDTLDISNNQVFTDKTTILFYNQAILNGKEVRNGVTIDYPGNYDLEYNGYTYRFIVEPIVTGVIDNEVYQEGVTPHIKSGKPFLNNDLYVSGTPITEPGNYVLKIEGLNGYEKLINFSITSNVSGVLNDQTYDNDVQIEFEGEGYLNNTYIESPYTVTEEGEYVLKIKGEGNYLDTYHFTVEEPEEETSIIDYVQKYDVVVLGVVVLIGGIILKKK